MFTKGKIPQSLIDAVKNVTEAEQIQEYESKDGKFVHKARPGAYGGSKPEKHELDTLRGPKKKDIEVSLEGQWKGKGEYRIPSNQITMQGVGFPVIGKPNVGPPVVMQPGEDYQFPEDVSYVDEVPLRHKKIETSLTHRDSSKIRDVLNISKDVALASVAQSPLDSSIVKKVYKATKKMYENKQRNTSTLYGIVGGSPCTENDDSRSRSREVRN